MDSQAMMKECNFGYWICSTVRSLFINMILHCLFVELTVVSVNMDSMYDNLFFSFHGVCAMPLQVPEEILVERVVGRRLDPVTGKIYHLKYSPPETQEIAERLTQRFDDTEEKVELIRITFHMSYNS